MDVLNPFTVSVVSVSAQLMMEDVSVCRACDSLEYPSHLSTVDLCDFLGVVVKETPTQECASRVMFSKIPFGTGRASSTFRSFSRTCQGRTQMATRKYGMNDT